MTLDNLCSLYMLMATFRAETSAVIRPPDRLPSSPPADHGGIPAILQ